MAMKTAFNAIINTGIDIRLFRRKDRHDLYGHNPMRNDADEYDSDFSDEVYEDNDMYNKHHNHELRQRKIILWMISIILAVIFLLTWLVFVPQNKLNNYPQTDGISPVVSIQIQKTHNLTHEYYVTIKYDDAHGHIQQISRLIQGDSLIVEGDTIQFPGSHTRFQLLEVTGQYKNVQSEPSISLPDNNIQPNDTDIGYLTTVQANRWMAPTVTINICTVILGPIIDYNSHNFTIQVSQNGACSKHQLS